MNRVLVTGASGFVGHHLCRYLAHKKYKVLGTYRAKRPGSLKSVCDLRCLDITDALAVAGLMQSYRPQYTVHLAAQSSPRMSWQTENETMDINVRGTINLLRAMREHASGSRFLFTSTNLVYGRSFRDGKSCSEQSPLSPESPYAISKVLAELACRDFHTKYGLDIIVARPFNHFGPGQKPPFVFADWCRQIAEAEGGRRKRVLEVGNLDAYRDLIPVQDVVEAYEVLLRKGRGGETYNV
ncbi:MAG: NAD-dependent epimerase/dehydratase family protein, partial [Candidatus Omnitrophota bacterium]|nr:NAD-dependent epimerase/dehydratase family protein [Candidatus Omnitrophota bacterium]